MIRIIDTLESMGSYPVVKAKDVEIGSNSRLDTAIENKVDKVSGKGLSTNDYTISDKNKVAEISNLFTKVEE